MNTHTHHTHSHTHDHSRPFRAGLLLGGAFVVAEIFYGIKANSLSLLADAGHNAGDLLGLSMVWGAALLARRKPTARFTYGLQSASILSALANALILMIGVGGLGLEALQRFGTPETTAAPTVIIIALLGALVNGFTAWLFHGHDHDLNMRGAFLHMAGDAAISLGVALSGFIILRTGWQWLDPAVSLLISLIIIAATWRLLRDSVSLALHAVPAHIDAQAVRAALAALPGVGEVHDLHIWAMSTTEVALSAHLRMPGGHPGDAFIHDAACELERRFHIGHATLQIEMGDLDASCQENCHSGCAA